MAVQEVVRVLRTLFQDDGETLHARYGPEAVAAAQDIQHILSIRLQEESAYASLWDRFKAAPQTVSAELTGALEAFVESDPAIARRLDAFIREYHEIIAPPGTEQASIEDKTVVVGSDALDTALKPGEVEASERHSPYEPDTASGVRFNASVERGTYLYGNVKGGQETIGRGVGTEVFDFGKHIGAVNLLDVAGIPRFFEQLSEATQAHPAIKPPRRKEIRDELDNVRAEVVQVEKADTTKLTQHLRKLQQLAPDIAEVLLNVLSQSNLGAAVQNAARDVQNI